MGEGDDIFYPDDRFHRIWEITPAWLRKQGLSVLLLDVDNTLTTHDSPSVDPRVTAWLEEMKACGIRLLILSNNKRERVEPFAKKLGLGCISRAAKPLGTGVRRACARLNAPKSGVGIVGDQIFTDVLCANLAGVRSILVDYMEAEPFLFFKMKRSLERRLMKRRRN